MNDQISNAQCLHLLRRQRHSFLNHLQVISGWLQLNRPERARQYLDAVAMRMTGESDVLREANACLGLLMLELGLEAETHGVHLEWRTGGGPSALDAAQLEALREQVLQRLAAGGIQTLTVDLAGAGFSVHTPAGQGKG